MRAWEPNCPDSLIHPYYIKFTCKISVHILKIYTTEKKSVSFVEELMLPQQNEIACFEFPYVRV